MLYWQKWGPGFIKWVRLLYEGPVARVRTGRVISAQYRVERGMHQGSPLSPLLFALAMEPLACRARSVREYKGLQVGGQTHHIAL